MKYKFKKDSTLYLAWNSPEVQKGVLPALIVHYSTKANTVDMEKEMEDIDNYTMPSITRSFDDSKFELNTEVYRALLKVVEIVVPY